MLRSRTRRLRTVLPALVLAALLPSAACAQQEASAPRPTLLVFLTVDQMRADYLTTRFGAQLTGGLRRLRDGGALFTNAHQDHAITETAPGHASTMSGRFPAHTGIFRNAAGVQDPQAPLLDGGTTGAGVAVPLPRLGARRLAALGRSAHARAQRRAARTAAPSCRSAAPSSRCSGTAATGRFTTSTLLRRHAPRLGAAASTRATSAAATPGQLDAAARAVGVPRARLVAVENGGKDYTFPHALPADPTRAAAALPETPWMDEADARGRAGRRRRARARPRAADRRARRVAVVDRRGGAQVRHGLARAARPDPAPRPRRSARSSTRCYTTRDSARMVFALTADHGMAPYPELHFPAHDPAPRPCRPGRAWCARTARASRRAA